MKGWQGLWELITWDKLIVGIVLDLSIPLEELLKVPKGDEIRGTNLYYSVTSLDAWGDMGNKARAKSAVFTVTPAAWKRSGVMWLPGTMADRTATPIRLDHNMTVKVMVKMVKVPFKGIYSVRASIEEVEGRPLPPIPEAKQDKPKKKKEKGFKA